MGRTCTLCAQLSLPLLTYEPTDPISDTVLLKHCHAMLTRDLLDLDASVSRSTGSLVATNIGDLVLDQRSAWIKAEALRKRKEDKRENTFL